MAFLSHCSQNPCCAPVGIVPARGIESHPSCSHSSHKTHCAQGGQEQWEGALPQVVGIALPCTPIHHGWFTGAKEELLPESGHGVSLSYGGPLA